MIDPARSLVFENEPSEANVIQLAPRDVTQPLFGRTTLVLQGLGVLLVVLWVRTSGRQAGWHKIRPALLHLPRWSARTWH